MLQLYAVWRPNQETAWLQLILFAALLACFWREKRNNRKLTEAVSAHAENGRRFGEFVNESQVVADQMVSAVEEVNGAIGNLTEIADNSTKQEEKLQEKSRHAMEQIGQAFSSLQQVASAADQITDLTVTMRKESEFTKDTVLDISRKLDNSDTVMDCQKQLWTSVDKRLALSESTWRFSRSKLRSGIMIGILVHSLHHRQISPGIKKEDLLEVEIRRASFGMFILALLSYLKKR
jgi:ABC-type transporter Mla subunit MlaD